jgi:hypothetical protein
MANKIRRDAAKSVTSFLFFDVHVFNQIIGFPFMNRMLAAVAETVSAADSRRSQTFIH